jgi:hypothetical protein
MTLRRMRIACWIPKATNTLTEYVILCAFLLQQLLHERASMLGYTYIACLVLTKFSKVCVSLRYIRPHVIQVLLVSSL